MNKATRLLMAIGACTAVYAAAWSDNPAGQSQLRGVDQTLLLKPLAESWPSYSGDYSGKRYSALTQINQSNVKNLTLAWSTRIQPGMPAAGGGVGSGSAQVRR